MTWNHEKGMENMLDFLKGIAWLAGFFLGIWLAPSFILLVLTGNCLVSYIFGIVISFALYFYWQGASQR